MVKITFRDFLYDAHMRMFDISKKPLLFNSQGKGNWLSEAVKIIK